MFICDMAHEGFFCLGLWSVWTSTFWPDCNLGRKKMHHAIIMSRLELCDIEHIVHAPKTRFLHVGILANACFHGLGTSQDGN